MDLDRGLPSTGRGHQLPSPPLKLFLTCGLVDKDGGKWFSLPVITIPLFTSVACITVGSGQNEPSFPFFPLLSGFCLPISEITDGLRFGPKRRQQLLIQHPRRSQTSSAQTVQQLLLLFGQHLRGPDTTRRRAENKGQRQEPCSHLCRSPVIRVCPWQTAACLLKPIAGKCWYMLPRRLIAFVTQ